MLSRLIKEEKKQYRIESPLLLLFSMPFIVWQMGVLFFSGTSMSLFGRTPIPVEQDVTVAVIAAGYLVSIFALCLFPRKAVLMERILLPFALLSTVLMLFPFSARLLSLLSYISVFCCVFSIGAMLSVASQHFTVETTWRDGIISMTGGGMMIAVLQNDLFRVSFTAFTVFSILLIAAETLFFFAIPLKITARYVSREDGAKMPAILFIGIWLVIGFSTLLICFASSYAESVENGVSALYLSAAVMAVLLYFIRKRRGAETVRIFGVFFSVAIFGFVLAYLSLQLPALRIPACICMGFVVVLANLWTFFSAVAFRVHPIGWIGALGAATGLVLAMLHSGILELLRDNLSLLYGLYAAFSVALLIIYYYLEPYFTRAWVRLQDERKTGGARKEKYSAASFARLSEQEGILAELILDGYSETAAASRMNITLNTQKGYRKNLYSKLGIHTKRELFELANRKDSR